MGLVTGSLVKREKILATFGNPVKRWASENDTTLPVSDFLTDIEGYRSFSLLVSREPEAM